MEKDAVINDKDDNKVEDAEGRDSEGEQVEQPYTGKLAFMRYGEITNVESSANFKKIAEEGFLDPAIEFVMTEKVHGANFSLSTDGKEVVASKRTSILLPSTKFYNYQKILKDHEERMLNLHNHISQLPQFATVTVEQITVFGELFGGIYPSATVPKDPMFPMHVQKGVYYSPSLHFYVFDIKIAKLGYLDFNTMESVCIKFNFLYSKALRRGSAQELLKFDVEEFVTTLPVQFGLPPIDPKFGKNIAEGVVIKPVVPKFLSDGSRVIIKHKSDAFKEVAGAKIRKDHKKALEDATHFEIDPEVKEYSENLLRYVTANRLRNVISKLGPVKRKDLPKLIGLLAQDCMKDFNDDFPQFKALEKDKQKKVTARLSPASKNLVESNSETIVKGEF